MATGVQSSVSQSPTNRSMAFLKTFVINYVQGDVADAELRDIAGRGINSAIDVLNTRDWLWNYKYQDITLAASTADYALNSDVKKPRKLQLRDSSGNPKSSLVWQDPKTFWDLNPYSVQDGSPTTYTMISNVNYGKLTLNHAPASTFVTSYPTARLRYIARILHLSNDGDVLNAPPEYWTFCGWYARWDLAMVRGKEGVDRAFAMWNRLLRDLKSDDNEVDTDFL